MPEDIKAWVETLGPTGILGYVAWSLLKEVKPALNGLKEALLEQTKVNVAVLEHLRKGGN